MLAVSDIGRIEQENIARAFFQNIFGNNRIFFFFGIIVEEEAFTYAAAGYDDLFPAGYFQETLNHAGASQDDVGTVTAKTGKFTPLLQVSLTQIFEGGAKGLGGKLEVMYF